MAAGSVIQHKTICQSCGKELEEGSEICTFCGARQKDKGKAKSKSK
jgi:rRNA maturation endonuclease Nob1